MRPVLVGTDPGSNGPEPLDPAAPSGARLAEMAGLCPDEFVDLVDRVNLHTEPLQGTTAGPDRVAGRNLTPVLRGRRVVALGWRVASALNMDDRFLTWRMYSGRFVGAVLPHPSGLNRWYNDPDNRAAAGRFARRLVRPCVHVEGPDGSGKSAVALHLAGLGMDLVPTEGPPDDWFSCLLRIERRLAPGSISDRSSGLVSELVYGPVLRGAVHGSEEWYWQSLRSMYGAVTFVYCRPPESAMVHEARSGEDPDHVRAVAERQSDLVARYDEVFARMSREGARVVRYDWTRSSPEELARCVV